MTAQVIIDNGDGIHLAIIDDDAPVYVHRFDNVDDCGTNCRTQLGECIVSLITDGDWECWEGNDLEEWPTVYDELTDAYDIAAEIEL